MPAMESHTDTIHQRHEDKRLHVVRRDCIWKGREAARTAHKPAEEKQAHAHWQAKSGVHTGYYQERLWPETMLHAHCPATKGCPPPTACPSGWA